MNEISRLPEVEEPPPSSAVERRRRGSWIAGLVATALAAAGWFGLAAMNAILIVEFVRQGEEEAATAAEAAVRAPRTRLRPILMTSFAFILCVAPLVVATGAGLEMRQSLGTAVFAGMLGVNLFGLLFTPVFYTAVRKIGGRRRDPAGAVHATAAP
ncbi:efflux RND transporter permease subunit [Inquilinus sp. YAF38]|uniref:efflux RND transporter permease subunit n=1 Tax=Inquilinus sp. YAF38 TaxID=3233084 RepID=UPI003F92C032